MSTKPISLPATIVFKIKDGPTPELIKELKPPTSVKLTDVPLHITSISFVVSDNDIVESLEIMLLTPFSTLL